MIMWKAAAFWQHNYSYNAIILSENSSFPYFNFYTFLKMLKFYTGKVLSFEGKGTR